MHEPTPPGGGSAAAAAAVSAAVPVLLAGQDRVELRDPVFISDLHLCAQRPATAQAFFTLCARLPAGAELVILGDLFEYWAGDDTLAASQSEDDALARAVVQALHDCTARGTAVYVMRGNRDVLLGAHFLAASGARLLADPCIAQIGVTPTLLAHGDAYCTLDTAYQAFRVQARDPRFQTGFLQQPLAARRALIGQARGQSEATKQQLDMQIMDVTPEAIAQALADAGVRAMIHGHTHRPACHREDDGTTRWVLPDWELEGPARRGGGLRLLAGQLQAFAL